MAQLAITLSLEADAFHDAVRELEEVARALARRHGDAFRALDRRLSRLLDDDGDADWGACAAVHHLEGGLHVMVPAGELLAVLQEGRRLRVLS